MDETQVVLITITITEVSQQFRLRPNNIKHRHVYFLRPSLGRARASRDHFFLSLDLHELWHGHNGCLSFT